MRFLGRRNQWGRRPVPASGAETSDGQQRRLSDHLAPDRLEDVFRLAYPVGSDRTAGAQRDEDSQSTAGAGPSQGSDDPVTARSAGFQLAEVLERAETVPEVWELGENEPEVAEVVETLPEVWELKETGPEVTEVTEVAEVAGVVETVPQVWELEESDAEVAEVVDTVPAVLVPKVPAMPLPAPSGTGRHRSTAPSKSVGFRGFGLTVRRAALLGALMLIVVLGALFALL